MELAEILEQELEDAFEVKSKKSLHRYILLLTDNIIQREEYLKKYSETKSDIRVLAETMKEGFEAMDKRFEAVDKRFEAVDKRFEAVDKRFEDLQKYMDKRFEDLQKYGDKRFEDMNKRFSMMFTFMNIGFSILVLITVIFKFVA